MTLTLNYTYRIYPDNKQEAMLSEWLEICRRSYNYALRELKHWISSRKCLLDRWALPTLWYKKYNRLHTQNGGLRRRPKLMPFSLKSTLRLTHPTKYKFYLSP